MTRKTFWARYGKGMFKNIIYLWIENPNAYTGDDEHNYIISMHKGYAPLLGISLKKGEVKQFEIREINKEVKGK